MDIITTYTIYELRASPAIDKATVKKKKEKNGKKVEKGKRGKEGKNVQLFKGSVS
jgi:hypothetical protein